jgi:hypothetical protein
VPAKRGPDLSDEAAVAAWLNARVGRSRYSPEDAGCLLGAMEAMYEALHTAGLKSDIADNLPPAGTTP